MTKAICTLAHNLPDWFDRISKPRLEEYAKRIGAEFVLFQPESYDGFASRGPLFEEVCLSYDRTCFIDADTVVSREAPDIFAEHEEGHVWMAPDSPPGDDDCACRWHDIVTVQSVCGAIRWTKGYGNMGVVLVDRKHSYAFRNWLMVPTTHNDQAYFNWNIRQFQLYLPTKKHSPNYFPMMSRRWNRMCISAEASRPGMVLANVVDNCQYMAKDAYICHAAGFSHHGPENLKIAMEVLEQILP